MKFVRLSWQAVLALALTLLAAALPEMIPAEPEHAGRGMILVLPGAAALLSLLRMPRLVEAVLLLVAAHLTAWLLDAQKLPLEAIRTHRDVAQGQTECPGRDFYRYIEDGQFKHWVKGVLDGENPTIEPGPPLADPPGPTELVTKTTK